MVEPCSSTEILVKSSAQEKPVSEYVLRSGRLSISARGVHGVRYSWDMGYVKFLLTRDDVEAFEVKMYFEDNPLNIGDTDRANQIITLLMLLNAAYFQAIDALRVRSGRHFDGPWLCSLTGTPLPEDELNRRFTEWLARIR